MAFLKKQNKDTLEIKHIFIYIQLIDIIFLYIYIYINNKQSTSEACASCKSIWSQGSTNQEWRGNKPTLSHTCGLPPHDTWWLSLKALVTGGWSRKPPENYTPAKSCEGEQNIWCLGHLRGLHTWHGAIPAGGHPDGRSWESVLTLGSHLTCHQNPAIVA